MRKTVVLLLVALGGPNLQSNHPTMDVHAQHHTVMLAIVVHDHAVVLEVLVVWKVYRAGGHQPLEP